MLYKLHNQSICLHLPRRRGQELFPYYYAEEKNIWNLCVFQWKLISLIIRLFSPLEIIILFLNKNINTKKYPPISTVNYLLEIISEKHKKNHN